MKKLISFVPIILLLSSYLISQTQYEDKDPFLGNYILGNSAEILKVKSLNMYRGGMDLYDFNNENINWYHSFGYGNNYYPADLITGDFDGDLYDESLTARITEWGTADAGSYNLEFGDYNQDIFAIYCIDSVRKVNLWTSQIRLVAGDFDDDPGKEFAVAYRDWNDNIRIRIGEYSPENGLVELAAIADIAIDTSLGNQACFDLTAGDYDGDGYDELILIKQNQKVAGIGTTTATTSFFLKVYDYNWKQKYLIPKGSQLLNWGSNCPRTLTKVFCDRLVITSGNFKGKNIDQCVIGFEIIEISGNYYYTFLYLWPFEVSSNLNTFTFNPSNKYESRWDGIGTTGIEHGNSLSLVSADLNEDLLNPSSSSLIKDELILANVHHLIVLELDDQLHPTELNSTWCWSNVQYNTHRTVAVADLNADPQLSDSISSHWVPEVVVSVVNKWEPWQQILKVYRPHYLNGIIQSIDLIHEYSTEDDSVFTSFIALGDFDGDAVRLGKPRRLLAENIAQPTVILNAPPIHFDVLSNLSYDICQSYPVGSNSNFEAKYIKSTTGSAELSTQVHSDWGVSASLSASASFLGFGVKATLNCRYGEGFSRYGLHDSSLTVTIGQSTIWDDRIFATVTDYSLFEYPVFVGGIKQGNILAAISHPKEPRWFPSHDRKWGNRIILNHEHANLLSYPNYNSPSDNPDVQSLIAKGPMLSIDETYNTNNFWSLNWGTIHQQGADTTNEFGFSVGASVKGWGFNFNTDANYDRGEIVTHKSTVSSNIEMTAIFGAIDAAYASATYSVLPYAYWSKTGSLVLDYLVDVSTGGTIQSFWEVNYFNKPDLAFNLFYRYKDEKGYSLPDNIKYWTKEITLTPEYPSPGDTVKITARLHNYSLKNSQNIVPVSFFYGNSDNNGKIIRDINGDSVFTTINPIALKDSATVEVNWQIPLGIFSSDSILYAVIDPQNSFDEIHEDNNKAWTRLDVLYPTGIDDGKFGPRLSNYTLAQNNPNPFNPNTKISWQSPISSHQTIKVYDILGNEIVTLVNEYKQAGRYEVEFQSAVGSRQLASGIYFYQLKAGEYVNTKKMILLK